MTTAARGDAAGPDESAVPSQTKTQPQPAGGDDATVVSTAATGAGHAPPADDGTVLAPPAPDLTFQRSAPAGRPTQTGIPRPRAAAPARPLLRSRAVAVALGVVTGLMMFGVTALWLLHGR